MKVASIAIPVRNRSIRNRDLGRDGLHDRVQAGHRFEIRVPR
jgi:hypothetical protein